jgi:uncharacterized membrane protein
MSINKKLILATAAAMAFATLPLTSDAAASGSATTNNMEKCFGITKAAMNDCATATESCAGSATKNQQPDAFIFLPKGTCNKIYGASLTPPTTKK